MQGERFASSARAVGVVAARSGFSSLHENPNKRAKDEPFLVQILPRDSLVALAVAKKLAPFQLFRAILQEPGCQPLPQVLFPLPVFRYRSRLRPSASSQQAS